MKYILLAKNNDYVSDLIWQLQDSAEVKIFFTDNPEIKEVLESDKFYIPSDTTYPLIRSLIDDKRKNIVDTLRDKHKFREKISTLFPNFTFDKINLADLKNYVFKDSAKYIVKPVTGFMGAGARVISKDSNLLKVTMEIEDELRKFSNLYPNIFSDQVIVEQYIEGGDEYAVDMYYDANGKPVIVNIYCHPAAKRQEYLQMLYYTNKEIFTQFYQQLVDFFVVLNQSMQVKSFPIHAEFKLDGFQKLIPIEFNTCRFGGMGLADLTYYAFGFHPINAFFDDFHPNWDSLWEQNLEENFCWILGYNSADLDISKHYPDHAKFQNALSQFSKLLAYKKLDHTKSPGFALSYLVTKQKNAIENILNIEFSDYFV